MSKQVPTNFEAFNLLTLVIFDRLFQRFPEQINITGSILVAEGALNDDLEEEIRSAVPHVLMHTMQWLKEEGFIRITNQTMDGEYQGVVLTLKGLTVLGYLPTALERNEANAPLINRVRTALAESGGTARIEIVRKIVGKAFELGISHIGA